MVEQEVKDGAEQNDAGAAEASTPQTAAQFSCEIITGATTTGGLLLMGRLVGR